MALASLCPPGALLALPGGHSAVLAAQGAQVDYVALRPQAAPPRPTASFRIAHHLPPVVDTPSDAVVTAQSA